MTTKNTKGPKPVASPSPEQEQPSPNARAAACGAEVQEVLNKHRCRLQPVLATPEAVGSGGDKAIIRADVVILAN